MKFRMHILEDPSELSPRAQVLLRRTGRREHPTRFGLPMELWRVRDHAWELVPAPMELIIRCEGFEQKFGGLRYKIRRSSVVSGDRYETTRGWEYDHLGLRSSAWQDPARGGWYFEWTGERVSKPCRDLIHTNGGVGTDIDGGSPCLPIAPSLPHLIESHALTDTVATWKPWPMDSLAASAIELLDGLVAVPEASWGSSRWRLSDTVAVMDYDTWDREKPRRLTRVWSRDEAGHREVQAVLDGSRNGPALRATP
ncbi:hypothetical protein P8A21_40755 (plasmid) [Streptomyces poriferorum]|uniref:hypothetical protein n=1 Tax=Streptomyces poriferorum TaxID=2798799 RepID=UPI00273F24CC|nr:hypothetical protein [Streptomyces sp. Alt1]WLQ53853.1 hypothetical protein P8A21_40755 [Streptomyces sp. Alt1]